MTGRASAPGSSANLGPGFDVLALAWETRCHAAVTAAARWTVSQDGTTWEPSPDDFVRRAASAVAPGPYAIEITNDVPRSRGLGSSSAVAAAIAAATARAAGADPIDEELFEIVTRLEGHADNAAATVYGGLVMVDGGRFTRLELSAELHFIAAIPDAPLRTHEARAALADEVARAVVVRSLSRFGFLVLGLRTGSSDSLARAGGDELHEAPRAALAPLSAVLMEAAVDAGAPHACWSGAGPTVLAIVKEPEVAVVTAALEKALDGSGEVRELVPALTGWR